jgi:hypothetical protein
MAFHVTILGHDVTCDTADEVVAVLQASTTTASVSGKKAPEKRIPRTIRGWVKHAPSKQRELLKALAASHPVSISDGLIKQQLGLESNRKIAGLMGGLAKAAKRSGLEFGSLIAKQSTRNGNGERHYSYGISPDVIAEVKEGLGMQQPQ